MPGPVSPCPAVYSVLLLLLPAFPLHSVVFHKFSAVFHCLLLFSVCGGRISGLVWVYDVSILVM